MLEKLFGQFPGVIQMLRDDHRLIRSNFAKYQKAEGHQKTALAKTVLRVLAAHAKLEDQVIYPAFRTVFRDKHIIDEAVEEHHLLHILLRELKALKPDQPSFEAKFTVLRELVTHHVDEEESQMFPKAEAQDIEWSALEKDAKALKKKLAAQTTARKRRAPRAQAA
jgi:hemerythrin superfamily protein